MEVGAGREVETVSDASTKSKEKELARTVKMPSLPARAVAGHREAVPPATKRPFQVKQRPCESIG
jgi:hypothetical protein